ncbi:MAG TPA: GDP-mannose 4,6-dehydratase [Chitinophagales bacterium]|nr:GDP-mannose 4,6-dehydratase [Chitinophagales bacterium]
MKKAIIIGSTGQDGTYLTSFLREHHYEVTGISGKTITDNQYGIFTSDIRKPEYADRVIKIIQPDEVYFLAAIHHSSEEQAIEDGELFRASIDVNVTALVNFLESIRKFSTRSRLFYAASSHVFGNPEKSPQDELTPFRPDCIYGITKSAGAHACRFYRERHRIFACAGILYNHESPLRGSKYVSKKIVEAAVAIRQGKKKELVLGNLDSEIDWGYAPDYVRGMHAMMQLPGPDDFIISSGEVHSIRDFVSEVFSYLGLDWKAFVKVNPALITKQQKRHLAGNNQKIRNATGWAPGVDFKGLIKILVDEELKKHGSE